MSLRLLFVLPKTRKDVNLPFPRDVAWVALSEVGLDFLNKVENVTPEMLQSITGKSEYIALLRQLSQIRMMRDLDAPRLLEIILSPVIHDAVWTMDGTLLVELKAPKLAIQGEDTLVRIFLVPPGKPERKLEISAHVFKVGVLAMKDAACNLQRLRPEDVLVELEPFPEDGRTLLRCSRILPRTEERPPLSHAATVAAMPASQPIPAAMVRPVQVYGVTPPPKPRDPTSTLDAVQQASLREEQRRRPSPVNPMAATPLVGARTSSIPPVRQVPRPSPSGRKAYGSPPTPPPIPLTRKKDPSTDEEHPSSPCAS